MLRKFFAYALLLTILATACTPSVQTQMPVSPTQVKAASSAIPSQIPTADTVVVPKQRDLIFVEFFAVT
jgi:hypothetical protein